MDNISCKSDISDERTTLYREHPLCAKSFLKSRSATPDEKQRRRLSRKSARLDLSTLSAVSSNIAHKFKTFKRILQKIRLRSAGPTTASTITDIRKVPLNPNEILLLRIANARRLVTSLGRHLSTKGDVMTQLRKRLLVIEVNRMIPGPPFGKDGGEISIYIGDVHGTFILIPNLRIEIFSLYDYKFSYRSYSNTTTIAKPL